MRRPKKHIPSLRKLMQFLSWEGLENHLILYVPSLEIGSETQAKRGLLLDSRKHCGKPKDSVYQ